VRDVEHQRASPLSRSQTFVAQDQFPSEESSLSDSRDVRSDGEVLQQFSQTVVGSDHHDAITVQQGSKRSKNQWSSGISDHVQRDTSRRQQRREGQRYQLRLDIDT